MTGLVETVRGKVENTCVKSGGLRKEGCTVSLQGAPRPRLIIDFDKPGFPLERQEIRCDYLFVAEVSAKPAWLALLELKRGKMDASEVVGQLKAGARAAEQLLPNTMPVNFRPIAACGGGMTKSERKELRAKRNKVPFHGTAEAVRLIKCGGKLIQGLQP